MTSYSSVEEFKNDVIKDPCSFKFLNEDQHQVYNILKKDIIENITKKPPKTRRFSLVLYGSHGIGKSFLIKYLLKELEKEGELKDSEYLYCSYANLRKFITREHTRLMYNDYQIEVIDKLVLKILKKYLFENNKKLVIFDDLSEELFLNLDFTASDFLYNQNGRGIIWVLSFKRGFLSRIDKKNINLIKLSDLSKNDLVVFLDRYFRNKIIDIEPNIKNLKDLIKKIR